MIDLPDGAPQSGLLAGVGRPGGWRLFFGVLVPVAWLLCSLCGEILCAWWQHISPSRAWHEQVIKRYMRLERYSLGALFFMALGLALHARLGDFHTVLGLFFMLVLAFKTLLLIWLLHQAALDPGLQTVKQGRSRLLPVGVGLVGGVFFWGLAFWTSQAVCSAGDEISYLYRVHELLHQWGLLQGHPRDAAIRAAFYWGQWPLVSAGKEIWSLLYPWLLMPGYWLAGRLGALMTMSALAALALAWFYLICRRLDFSRGRSLMAAWLVMSCPPMVLYSQQAYPEMAGAAGACLGMLYILAMPKRPWSGLMRLAMLALVLVLIKIRLAPIAVSLLLAGGFRFLWLMGGSRLVKWGVLLILLGLVLLVMNLPGTAGINRMLVDMLRGFEAAPGSPLAALAGAGALVFDQQFGLVAYTPWLLFALAGWWFLWRSRPLEAISALWVCGFYFLALVLWHWTRWQGGYAPPGRMLVCITPLLALGALPALSASAPRLWRSLLTAFFGLSLAISLCLQLFPWLRFQDLSGVNPLLLHLGRLSQAGLGRFFPGFSGYFGPDMLKSLPWAGLALLLLAWMGLWRAKQGRSPESRLRWRSALIILLIGFLALVGAGRYLPDSTLQAEAMASGGARRLGAGFPRPVYMVFRQPGTWASQRFVWGSTSRYLSLAAAGAPPGPGLKSPHLLCRSSSTAWWCARWS